MPSIYENKVVVITGAGSGIGRAFSLYLAKQSCNLALSDVNMTGLDETFQLCQQENQEIKITTKKLDVSNKDEFFAYAEEVKNQHGKVNMIINNAGVALIGNYNNLAIKDAEWLFNINFWGVIYGTMAFLPLLKENPRGELARVVNISSYFGLIGFPGQLMYSASKFGVRGFSETLDIELQEENSNVRCVRVHPGGIKTNIAKDARGNEGAQEVTELERKMYSIAQDIKTLSHKERAFIFSDKFLKSSPDDMVKTTMQAIEKGQTRILVGEGAAALNFFSRLFPESYWERMKFVKANGKLVGLSILAIIILLFSIIVKFLFF